MTQRMTRHFWVFAATVLLFLAAAYPATADLSLDVAPAKIELQVTPGTTQTIPVTVRNTGETPLHIQTSLVDFTVAPGGNYLFAKPGTMKYSLAGWASVNPREFDVAPNSFQLVRMTIKVPTGISGEYSGIAFFQTRPARHSGGGIIFSERVASKIYLYTPQGVRFDGLVDGFAAKQTGIGERFLIGFKNSGNAHIYLNGSIQIRKGSETVQRVTLPQQILVERGGRRVIEAYSDKLPAGKYTALALIDFGGPNLAGAQTSFTVK